MLKRIFDCAFRVTSQWTTIVGGVFTMIGTVQQYSDIARVPVLIWWLAAIIALLATAFRIQWQLLDEQDKNRKPQPNMKLEDAVKRIRRKGDIFGPNNSESAEVMRALTLLREHGSTGELTIFGSKEVRFVKPEHYDVAITRLPIPTEFWQTHDFDYIAFTDDQNGMTRDSTKAQGESRIEYSYI